jgi:anthranilate phosphoribosyltransferase
MRPAPDQEAINALLDRDRAIPESTWRSLWDRLDARRVPHGEAVALVAALSAAPPAPRSTRALVATLRERRPLASPAVPGSVNIVGTGGGPPTVNLSTAAAFVAATIGARVIKTGSRAYTSRCGSIDLLERLGVPLTASDSESEAMLEAFGIAFAGGYVYPAPLMRLARAVLPLDMRVVGRFFNTFGPLLGVVPVEAQVSGVAHAALVSTFRALAADWPGPRLLVCWNAEGVDELLSFAENRVYDGGADRERVLAPEALGVAAGSLQQLSPPADDAQTAGRFLALLAGEGPVAAVESIALNAAVLAVASGAFPGWSDALPAALESMAQGRPARLVDRMRGETQR